MTAADQVAELEQELHIEYRRRETAEILLSEFRRRVRAESQLGCTCRGNRRDNAASANGIGDKGKRLANGHVAAADSPKVSPRGESRGLKSQIRDPGGRSQNGRADALEGGGRQIVAAGTSVAEMEGPSVTKKGGEAVLQTQMAARGKGDSNNGGGEHELNLGLQTEATSWETIAAVLKLSTERRLNVGCRMKEMWQQLGKEMGSLAEVWAEEEDVLMKNMAWLAQSLQRAQEDLHQAHDRTAALIAVNEWQAEQLRSIHQQKLDTWCHGLGDNHPVPKTVGTSVLGLTDNERGRLRAILDSGQGESTDSMPPRKSLEEDEEGGGGSDRNLETAKMKESPKDPPLTSSLGDAKGSVGQGANAERSTSPRILDAHIRVLAALAIAEKGGLESPARIALAEWGNSLVNKTAPLTEREQGKSDIPSQIEMGKGKSENIDPGKKKSTEREGSRESRHVVLANEVCDEVLERVSRATMASAEDVKDLPSPRDPTSVAERFSHNSQAGDSPEALRKEGSQNSDGGNGSQLCGTEEQQQESLILERDLTGCQESEKRLAQTDFRRRPKSLEIPQGRNSSPPALALASAGSGTSSQSVSLPGGGGGSGAGSADVNGRLNGRGGTDGTTSSEMDCSADQRTEVVLRALSALQKELRQALAQDAVRQQTGGPSSSVAGNNSATGLQQQPSLVWSISDGQQLYYTSFPPSPSSTSTDSRDTSRPGMSSYCGGTDSQTSSLTGPYLLSTPLQQTASRAISKGEMAMPPGLDPFAYSSPWSVESDPIMVQCQFDQQFQSAGGGVGEEEEEKEEEEKEQEPKGCIYRPCGIVKEGGNQQDTEVRNGKEMETREIEASMTRYSTLQNEMEHRCGADVDVEEEPNLSESIKSIQQCNMLQKGSTDCRQSSRTSPSRQGLRNTAGRR
ncbi:hypothetical protein CBR_g19294 [Chara braunii]|uniref:Uncharacterized protein n=1 Tax=Chara braunii TaxID=69332 RepID=A0A388KXS6_CHABU|nr:hypothetical protein CBR_g19294 [Chara braunii]|eukprot:GBG74782.1 hypothetical protein CBR_g19294 [Chara braunii]